MHRFDKTALDTSVNLPQVFDHKMLEAAPLQCQQDVEAAPKVTRRDDLFFIDDWPSGADSFVYIVR